MLTQRKLKKIKIFEPPEGTVQTATEGSFHATLRRSNMVLQKSIYAALQSPIWLWQMGESSESDGREHLMRDFPPYQQLNGDFVVCENGRKLLVRYEREIQVFPISDNVESSLLEFLHELFSPQRAKETGLPCPLVHPIPYLMAARW